ncbi:MAG: type II toxin-antitoxin system VapC family toxin [Gemmatimonadales bacterium]|nr:type II toxin-antitoxin system VapC family toxin [Gemmatimonadales bacterium]
MNLVDSSAWLEYLAAGPNAGRFAAAIETVDELLVPTVILVEVTRRVMQQRGEDAALQVAALLHQGRIVPLDSGIALAAAKHGLDHKLPLADSIIFATAQQYNATLWTMDADFDGLPGVRYVSKRK